MPVRPKPTEVGDRRHPRGGIPRILLPLSFRRSHTKSQVNGLRMSASSALATQADPSPLRAGLTTSIFGHTNPSDRDWVSESKEKRGGAPTWAAKSSPLLFETRTAKAMRRTSRQRVPCAAALARPDDLTGFDGLGKAAHQRVLGDAKARGDPGRCAEPRCAIKTVIASGTSSPLATGVTMVATIASPAPRDPRGATPGTGTMASKKSPSTSIGS